MGKSAFCFENMADVLVVSASSQQLRSPATNMQDDTIARKWQGTGAGTDYVLVSGTQVASVVALFGLNLTATGSYRLRLSSVDSSGGAGDVYDSGLLLANVRDRYGSIIHLLDHEMTFKYLRIDLLDANVDYIEVGRVVSGLLHSTEVNFSYNWSRQWNDLSRAEKSESGQTTLYLRPMFRSVQVSFDKLLRSERYGFIEDMDASCGSHANVLFIADLESEELDHDTIYGLMTLDPVAQPYFNRYSRKFTIEERL